MSSKIATRLVLLLSLEGLALSTDCLSHSRQKSLGIIMLLLQMFNWINFLNVTVYYLVLLMLVLKLLFPSTVLFPYPRGRELKKELLKEAEIYTAFLLQKLFSKCLEKKPLQHWFRWKLAKLNNKKNEVSLLKCIQRQISVKTGIANQFL